MGKIPFNDCWFVRRTNDENRIQVTLPYDAMIAEPRKVGAASGTNSGWFVCEDYTYEKSFTAPEQWRSMNVILEFEGVYKDAEVYLNNSLLCNHGYGYTSFYVDLTQHLRYGEVNDLRVTVRNADQPNSRWYTGAGIYRPVWLHTLPRNHILLNGVKIRTLSYHPPRICVQLQATGTGAAQIEILDGDKILTHTSLLIDGSASADLELRDAVLWSPDTPQLYLCRVSYGGDIRDVWFGIRMVECSSKTGFLINGERILMRGACIHHDNGILGAAAHPYAEERKVRLLKEAGYNAIRSAHNPCSKALLDACDRLGMLVVDEYADMWYIHKTRYDYAQKLPNCWKNDLKTIVDKDFNHPSVVMYSIGNEVAETAQARGVALCREMTRYLHSLDDRPVTCGINTFFNFLTSIGFGVYSDKKAEKQAKSNGSRKPAKKVSFGSEFFNDLAGVFGGGFMKFGATLPGSDRKSRDAYAVLDVAGYNYGIERYRKDLKKYPQRVILGSETFCSDVWKFRKLAKESPAIIGDFVWTGIDHLGELGIGAWEYADYAPDFSHGCGWISAGAGRLDLNGRAWGESAYTRVVYGLDSIRMAVVRPGGVTQKHSPSAWRMTNALESWSWDGCEGKTAAVEVYARGASVGLFLNGKLLAKKRVSAKLRTVFRVKYEPGELKAVSYDAAGNVLCSTQLYSAGQETQLRLEPEKPSIQQEDLCYVRVGFTDSNGIAKPMARNVVQLHTEGGELLAFGSACPYYKRSYLTDTADTYYGEALAIIRPNRGEKTIRLTAQCAYGTANAQIEVDDAE